jgi:Rap1a immunity proteins
MTALTHTAVAFALMMGLSMNHAAAQGLTINDYRHPNTETDLSFNKGYLSGIKDGLIAYNMKLDHKLFCLPGDIPTLSFEEANDLMMNWARKRGADSNDMPLNLALLTALQKSYPCRASAR